MIANAGESDIVLVYMMDRFSRDPFDAPIYKRELQAHGVRLVSALEAIPDSPEGIIYEKLLEGLAACESRKTSIRSRRGMEGNALQCKTNGVRCFGYRTGDDGRYEIVPEEARRIAEMCVDGGEPKEIAEGRKRAAAALRAAQTGLSNILKAVEQGIVVPGTKERAEELEAQKDRAERELAMYDRKRIDPENFARFLQFGATLTDELLLDAFVYQVMVSDDAVVVTMNFDAESNEPARLEVSRVRTFFKWCPVCKNTRTMITVVNGAVYLMLPRAA